MNRYAITLPLDDVPLQDGDGGFVGVNDRIAPELLPQGWVAAAENVEFLSGEMCTRRGFVSPQYAQIRERLFGAGVFRDPQEGRETLVLVTSSRAWLLSEDGRRTEVELPETLDAEVSVRQAFDRLFLFRSGEVPWEYTGLGRFAEVERANLNDGTRPIPLAESAELLNDRLYVPEGDYVWASDLADYLRYAIGARQRFNAGRDDTIVRIFPFTQNTLLVFKGKSILALTGAVGDLSTARVEIVNPELGCIAPESVASVGADVLFLSPTGVYRVSQVVESRLGTAPTAVSYPIHSLLRRVNWKEAHRAQAVVWGDCYYLAVPIDRAERCNAIVSYNLATDAWEGVHTYGIGIDRLLLATYRGERRLWAIDFESGCAHLLYEGGAEDCQAPARLGVIGSSEAAGGGLTKWIYAPEAGAPRPEAGQYVINEAGEAAVITAVSDEAGGTIGVTSSVDADNGEALLLAEVPEPVAVDVKTRGYRGGNAGRKRFRLVQVGATTRGASVTTSIVTDGNEEAVAMAPAQRARSRAVNLDGSAWDTTNTGDDHGAKGREDYAVQCPIKCGSGIVLNREQAFTDRYLAGQRGRFAQVRIATTRGVIRIRAVGVEGTEIDRGFAGQR